MAPNSEFPAVDPLVRRRAIKHRWTDVLLLSLVSTGAVIAAGSLYVSCEYLASVRPTAVFLGAATVFAALYFTSGTPRILGASGLRHFYAYPPFWLAGVAGAVGVLGVVATVGVPTRSGACALDKDSLRIALASAWLPLTTIALMVGVASRLLGRGETRRDEREAAALYGIGNGAGVPLTTSLLAKDFESQKLWFFHDAPVGNPALNAFDHYAIAQRIARHLADPGRPPLALVGRVGSGKTTILAMTAFELIRAGRMPADTAIIRVSLWPFDTVDAAIRALLEALTAELAKHINTLPLFGLPTQYVDAIEGVASASVIAKVLRSKQSPTSILREYDRAASAIGLRLVLWIEDLERFSGVHSAADEASEVARVSPLRALMNELSACSSIQVVLSAALPSYRFELEKFARYVEGVPALDLGSAHAVLSAFRVGCLEEFKADIDPSSQEARDALWKSESPGEYAMLSRLAPGHVPVHRALALLCSTPRTLKLALRDCYDAWRVLHGEIDFNDLLVLSVIGAAEPSLKAVVIDHILDFQNGIDRDSIKENKNAPVEAAVANVLSNRNVRHRTAAEVLLLSLFPQWRLGGSSASREKPQGIASSHTDYWGRYLRRQVPGKDDSDQRWLSLIEQWRSGQNPGLPKHLVRNGADERLTVFLRAQCSSQEMTRLLGDVVREEGAVSPGVWRTEHFANGVAAVWATLIDTSVDAASLERVVVESIDRSIPDHLPVAYTLAKLFGDPSKQVPSRLDRDASRRIRDAFRRGFLDSYPGSAQRLAGTLRDAAVEVLYHSCRLADLLVPLQQPVPPEWKGVADTIVAATEGEPAVMAPQVSLFVISQAEPGGDLIFDEVAAAKLFDVDRLLGAVREAQPSSMPDWAERYFKVLLNRARSR